MNGLKPNSQNYGGTVKYQAEYKPTWRHFDDYPPPKGTKVLFKADNGPAVIGAWYQECGWTWWAPLPSHSEEDKLRIRNP